MVQAQAQIQIAQQQAQSQAQLAMQKHQDEMSLAQQRASWDAQLKLAANYAQGAAGSCELSGNVACSTNGLGGDQTTLGASYRVLPHASFFGLVVRMRNNPASYYGSSAQGADVNSLALGIRIDYP
jgi:type II secretory pathway pseudopilin PulG